MLGVMVAVMVFTILSLGSGGFSLLTIHVGFLDPSNMLDTQREDILKRDAIFMGGATVFSLVAFGVLVNIAFRNNSTPPPKKGGFYLFMVGVVFAAISAYMLMFTACCMSSVQSMLMASMIVMFIGALMGLFGYADIIGEWFKGRGPDPPSASGQTGDSPSL